MGLERYIWHQSALELDKLTFYIRGADRAIHHDQLACATVAHCDNDMPV